MSNPGKKIKQILIPNKNPNRFFGIDYFASLYDGSDFVYRYYASLMDQRQTFSNNLLASKLGGLEVFEKEIMNIQKGSIIGFCVNPDPYNLEEKSLNLMHQALEMIKKYQLGVFIETSSNLILRDLEIIKEISKNAPAVVAIVLSHTKDPLTKTFEGDHASTYHERLKLIHKLKNEGLKVGALIKPVIPFINDSEEIINEIVNSLVPLNIDFIYPNFVLSISDEQRLNFIQLVNQSFPGLKNLYMDRFGIKRTWTSTNQQTLKKEFVFACKKNKIRFGMKEIVEFIHPNTFEQFSLF